jgi:hypothetical protein
MQVTPQGFGNLAKAILNCPANLQGQSHFRPRGRIPPGGTAGFGVREVLKTMRGETWRRVGMRKSENRRIID